MLEGASMLQGQSIETTTVVAFRPVPRRTVRERVEETERGTLLLFTGVRYERMTDAEPASDPAADDIDGTDDA